MITDISKHLVTAAIAAAAIAIVACEDSSTGASPTLDKATIDADLQEMSLKIKAFGAPEPPDAGMEDGGFESGFKRSAAQASSDCELEGKTIETWMDTTVAGGIGTSYDTTESYTQANALVCDFEDVAAYQLTRSYYRNDLYESWFNTRSNIPDFAAILTGGEFAIKLTGSGRVHYFSDYSFDVTSLDFSMKFSLADEAVSEVSMKMNLSLDGGRYTVPLGLAPGVDITSEEDPDPDAVQYVGPIQQNGATVGWFEVMGDERVVIRDEAKNIVEVH